MSISKGKRKIKCGWLRVLTLAKVWELIQIWSTNIFRIMYGLIIHPGHSCMQTWLETAGLLKERLMTYRIYLIFRCCFNFGWSYVTKFRNLNYLIPWNIFFLNNWNNQIKARACRCIGAWSLSSQRWLSVVIFSLGMAFQMPMGPEHPVFHLEQLPLPYIY